MLPVDVMTRVQFDPGRVGSAGVCRRHLNNIQSRKPRRPSHNTGSNKMVIVAVTRVCLNVLWTNPVAFERVLTKCIGQAPASIFDA